MNMKSKNEKREAFRRHLRERIVTILSTTTLGKTHTRLNLEEIADHVMDLFGDCARAPENRKVNVWTAGERRVLRDLGGPG